MFAASTMQTLTQLSYLVAAALLLLGLLATIKLARAIESDLDNLKFSFILGGLALPLVVPHLFLYDLGALVPAAAVILMPDPATDNTKAELHGTFRKILLALWLIVTCYCLLLLVNTNLASPIILVFCMLAAYLIALFAVFKSE